MEYNKPTVISSAFFLDTRQKSAIVEALHAYRNAHRDLDAILYENGFMSTPYCPDSQWQVITGFLHYHFHDLNDILLRLRKLQPFTDVSIPKMVIATAIPGKFLMDMHLYTFLEEGIVTKQAATMNISDVNEILTFS